MFLSKKPRLSVFRENKLNPSLPSVWWIAYLSPALNPILYALRLRVIRKEIKNQVSRAFSVNGVSLFKKNKVHMMSEEGRKTEMMDLK